LFITWLTCKNTCSKPMCFWGSARTFRISTSCIASLSRKLRPMTKKRSARSNLIMQMATSLSSTSIVSSSFAMQANLEWFNVTRFRV
jgi:hypothetical protein